MWYPEEAGMVLAYCGAVLLRGWCGTLKRVVWYFEEGGLVLLRWWRGTLKMVLWYFDEVCVIL